MNYRHAYHAGNFADVFKHALLARMLDYLKRKESGFRYIDTHAGPGRYDLSGGEASRTGEWRDGIGRFAGADLPADVKALLQPYFQALGTPPRDGGPYIYSGSPSLAQKLLRKQDRLTLCELHPDDSRALERSIGRDNRVRLLNEDGYRALKGLTPPTERRGLVLIDPPFESRDEFETMEAALYAAWRKWPTGMFALWYPVKEIRPVAHFITRLKEREIPRMLRLELTVELIRTDGPLAATGLILVNPPFVLEAEARTLLPVFAKLMARGPGAGFAIEQMTGEASI
ncbi:MAG: rRNA ((2030)-N(6))-methyltransferase RlmJ [Hyphomicrobiales bacterium]|nr:rRNA ((2030)-N(6))-methyltransferase RlmJ [Hyphomicrobiales bacterium]